MFLADRGTPLFAVRGRARALDSWRGSARVVSARWEVFRDAEPESRSLAFASYIAALDTEEAAAAEMAGLLSTQAA